MSNLRHKALQTERYRPPLILNESAPLVKTALLTNGFAPYRNLT